MKKTVFSVFVNLLAFCLWLAPATAQPYVHAETLEGHTASVSSVAFINNNWLVSGGYDQTLRAWNLRSGRELWNRNVAHQVYAIAVPLHAPFYTAYGGSTNYSIRMRYSQTGEWRGRIQGHAESVSVLMFNPETHLLASGSFDNTIKIWDTRAPRDLRLTHTLAGHTDDVLSVAWSPDGEMLASGGVDNTVRLWNPNNRFNAAVMREHQESVSSVAWSPDGEMLASGSADDTIRIWDVDTERTLRILTGHTDDVLSIAWSPDGNTLASGSADDTVKFWNLNVWENTDTLTGHTDDVLSVAWSPDGNIFVSSSADGTIRIWETRSLDVTGNGIVNINDLVVVAQNYGETVAGGANRRADVNADGRVDIEDIIMVAKAINPNFAAPSVAQQLPNIPFTAAVLQQWIQDARTTGIDAEGIAVLEQLLTTFTQPETLPLETTVFANYPNPFNPETWIPYQLAAPAEVMVSIHAADGKLVRTLELGNMPAGVYQSKSRAAYWDGRNTQGERVASGVYFYTLKAGNFSATQKMLIRK